jgi:predicted AlkP superfamily pyrophosphatase or phosphodiesterase
MRRLILLLALFAVTCAPRPAPPREAPAQGTADRPPLILISLDGFGANYFDKAPTPTLRELMRRGTRAESMIPSFPSKTFPNHYTIVTGLYPEHHGIIANNMKDPATGRTFALSKPQEVGDAMWWGGEPIWVTAERAGIMTAAMFWPGTEAPIMGVRPAYWKVYDAKYPPAQRVDQVLEWLERPPPNRPGLITLYFSDVDTAGHDYGPDSPQVTEAIRAVDSYLARLVRGLEQRALLDTTNIIVVSDHGMAAVDTNRVVVLDDYISTDDVEVADINPTLGLFPKAGKEESIYRALANAHPRLKVYRRNETPERWHYRAHPRIPPIVGVADEGWQVLRRRTLLAMRAGIGVERGAHGYDPDIATSMRAIFVAAGPAFRQDVTIPAFKNVHVYNALAELLGVKPVPNDGEAAISRTLLRPVPGSARAN